MPLSFQYTDLRLVERIRRDGRRLAALSPSAFADEARELKWSIRAGASQSQLMQRGFALGFAASHRVFGYEHYPVQLLGAIGLFRSRIVEMQTGEGKTLTAVLPVLLKAMKGQGVHVVTANEYLARRDAETMAPVYQLCELSTGCIVPGLSDDDRRTQYQRDITYATASELGFDFLRDRLKKRADPFRFSESRSGNSIKAAGVQRGQHFALIDEADSILIDEARTPLIIGVEKRLGERMPILYSWCRDVVERLEPGQDFRVNSRHRRVDLTPAGCASLNAIEKPVDLNEFDGDALFTAVEKALAARHLFVSGRDYLVSADEVAIIDEGTGRKLAGRKWQAGLHQAIEAKENLPLSSPTGVAATMTIQTLFRSYTDFAGMTGTATPVRRELQKIYRRRVVVIPTNRPVCRSRIAPRLFVSFEAKLNALLTSVSDMIGAGRAVLIGTPSVDASEQVSSCLKEAAIEHAVLSARHHEEEASIVSRAGEPGTVTVATNMAGRGTDILLSEQVRSNGGLHVIATEMHSSERIDRQLIGRAARQGDPGSFRFLLSLDDELLSVFPLQYRSKLKRRGNIQATDGELPRYWLRYFRRAQRIRERSGSTARRKLLHDERARHRRLVDAGLDPFLDRSDSAE
ncbi:preprotein translocase subunit SecA [Stratiformator vulcanicus]|uniref:Protein translocase subunit SecA n=1 Tax=Stratiformator vulcanicus TaxID=2527980 RepID=A0A517R103_9PLAN|nr:translocase [Stratiformator vulcanicus]QDT37579.1 preprotein translocase subunit SecA [Stratiformator vulcanicus]